MTRREMLVAAIRRNGIEVSDKAVWATLSALLRKAIWRVETGMRGRRWDDGKQVETRGCSASDRARSVSYSDRVAEARRWGCRQPMSPEKQQAARARDDKKFRARLIAKLRRQAKRLNTLVSDPEKQLARRVGDAKARGEVRYLSSLIGIQPNVEWVPGRNICLLPLSAEWATLPKDVKPDLHVAKGTHYHVLGGYDNKVIADYAGESRRASHGWRTICHADRRIEIRAIGMVLKGGRASVVLFGNRRTYREAPEGWEWRIDSNGLGLFGNRLGGPDIHVGVSSRRTVDQLVEDAEAALAQRTLLAEASKREVADAANIWVCFDDSIAAGNCRAGTEGFVARMGLSPGLHYRAADLLRLAPDEPRLKIAIRQAARREAEDMRRGYSILPRRDAR